MHFFVVCSLPSVKITNNDHLYPNDGICLSQMSTDTFHSISYGLKTCCKCQEGFPLLKQLHISHYNNMNPVKPPKVTHHFHKLFQSLGELSPLPKGLCLYFCYLSTFRFLLQNIHYIQGWVFMTVHFHLMNNKHQKVYLY